MKPGQQLYVSVLLILCGTWSANGGNILVWYTEGSHWINLKPVLETLVDRGHKVTVLVPSTSMFMNISEPSRFSYEPFNVSVTKEDMEEMMQDTFNFLIYETDHMSYWQIYNRFMEIMKLNSEYILKLLDGVLKSETIMKKLKEGKYDILFSDPIYPGSELVADILNIPLVLTLRFSMANNWERHCGQVPAPPSFVPGTLSKLTDKMTFMERVWSFLFYQMQDLMQAQIMWKEVDKHYSEYRGTPTSSCELLGKADFWLMRTYWDFEFPRPFLPNFKYVGGIHCRPAQPLPEDMEEFVQSSGDAGVVVFTLGSMVKNMTTERANMIASGLALLPQKVLWRYSGEKPETLGANTKIYNWIPQNDLLDLKATGFNRHVPSALKIFGIGGSSIFFLETGNGTTLPVCAFWGVIPGNLDDAEVRALLEPYHHFRTQDYSPKIAQLVRHPKTRAFITHGGTNGIYEAIYHGVPMVGIPLFVDQPDNMLHMEAKGAAVTLQINFMKSEDLRDAVNTVINDKSYKENAMRLSSIHHDRPMSPRDEAVFWIEYTMRNKGAKHLRVQAHELTWYQYHSLDVLGFFLLIDLLLIFIFFKTCTFCFRRCCGRKSTTKRKAE